MKIFLRYKKVRKIVLCVCVKFLRTKELFLYFYKTLTTETNTTCRTFKLSLFHYSKASRFFVRCIDHISNSILCLFFYEAWDIFLIGSPSSKSWKLLPPSSTSQLLLLLSTKLQRGFFYEIISFILASKQIHTYFKCLFQKYHHYDLWKLKHSNIMWVIWHV